MSSDMDGQLPPLDNDTDLTYATASTSASAQEGEESAVIDEEMESTFDTDQYAPYGFDSDWYYAPQIYEGPLLPREMQRQQAQRPLQFQEYAYDDEWFYYPQVVEGPLSEHDQRRQAFQLAVYFHSEYGVQWFLEHGVTEGPLQEFGHRHLIYCSCRWYFYPWEVPHLFEEPHPLEHGPITLEEFLEEEERLALERRIAEEKKAYQIFTSKPVSENLFLTMLPRGSYKSTTRFGERLADILCRDSRPNPGPLIQISNRGKTVLLPE